MRDASAAYQTVLLISIEMPEPLQSPAAGKPRAQSEEQLAFVEKALRDCGLCHGTRIGKNELIGFFTTPDSALEVACGVQQACTEHGRGSSLAKVRILLDRQSDDLLEDKVPYSAAGAGGQSESRMKRVPPGQIFATKAITARLSEVSRARFRLYEQDVAGAAAGTQLYQVICNEETVTRIAISTLHQERSATARSLCLRWRDKTLTLVPQSPSLTIGRGEQSDIQVDSDLASRIHARLGFQQTNFILTDQSTNGTFVQIDDDEEAYLHHEQIVLRGHGVISLGRHIRGGGGKLIYFKLIT